MDDVVIVEREGPIERLTLNRPDRGNMLTLAMVAGLTEQTERSGRDDVLFDCRVVIVTDER